MENIIQIQEDRASGIQALRDMFDEHISITRVTNDHLHKSYVFDNQIETAKEIIYNFYSKQNRWSLLFAEMQSGKSGTFFSVPYIISRNKILSKKLEIDMFNDEINVFLLTGMNEKELISQFESDIQSFTGMDIKKNVLHNSEMRKFLSRQESEWNMSDRSVIERMRKNSLILIDESHYGSDKNQILDKFLKNILKINPNGDNLDLIKNNIYVVSISATPMAEFLNANLSEFKKKIVPLKNAKGYFGIIEMFDKNKVYHSFDLKSNLSIDRMIDTILSINENGYILVRCPVKQQNLIIKRISERLTSKSNSDISLKKAWGGRQISGPSGFLINYDQYSKSTILDNMGINDILDQKPDFKKIIFLKGLLRAGKRVNTKNVIMIHDTSESKVDTTVQSLLGRCCGYGKNNDILIYCDKISADKYKKWVESSYSLEMIPDKSKNINGSSRLMISSFRDPIEFDVSDNDFINNMMPKRKRINDRIDILKSLNNSIIQDIIDKCDYTIGSIFNVDITKHNNWINGGDQYTSYQKQYLDVLNGGGFMGDYKPDDSSEDKINDEIGKIVFSAAYEIQNKKLLVSFGKIVKSSISSSDKSMYHRTNIII